MMKISKWLASLSDDDRDYALRRLLSHAETANREQKLFRVLVDFDFIEAKVFALPLQLLIDDYDLASRPGIEIDQETKESLKLIQSAIELAANVLSYDPAQLASQLWGRLLSFPQRKIQALLVQTQESKAQPWLRPLTANLTPPKGALLRTLSGHRDWVQAVAITPDDKIAVSASQDCTLKVWNLSSGANLHTFTGHDNWGEHPNYEISTNVR
jgi:WD40 repeat protein